MTIQQIFESGFCFGMVVDPCPLPDHLEWIVKPEEWLCIRGKQSGKWYLYKSGYGHWGKECHFINGSVQLKDGPWVKVEDIEKKLSS